MSLRCVVTAGPTFESLDAVRRLTNFSTGKLGCQLAAFLADRGHDVVLLKGEAATHGGETRAAMVQRFTSTGNLLERFQALAETGVDAVFHAAAVSDFTFGRVFSGSPETGLKQITSGKFSTREGTLLAELVPTPKVIAGLRALYPKARLVGWKYEVDGDRAAVEALARRQLVDCRTDACVANGAAYGFGFGIVTAGGLEHFSDTGLLYAALERLASAKTTAG
jgi:phosphopantothenoylcysteine decarboxylase/phosphopantothenate--cysteine ligase